MLRWLRFPTLISFRKSNKDIQHCDALSCGQMQRFRELVSKYEVVMFKALPHFLDWEK
jgi:hypothetical protein